MCLRTMKEKFVKYMYIHIKVFYKNLVTNLFIFTLNVLFKGCFVKVDYIKRTCQLRIPFVNYLITSKYK